MEKKGWLRRLWQAYSYMFYAFFIVAAVLLVDLLSKHLVMNSFDLYEQRVIIPHIINFYYVKNTGAAFSFLGDWEHARTFFIILTIVSVIAFSAILVIYGKKEKMLMITFSLIIGGAVGNLVDRIVFHYVRDFISFDFISFPTFNVADCALTVGVFLFAFYYIFIYKEKKEPITAEGAECAEQEDAEPKDLALMAEASDSAAEGEVKREEAEQSASSDADEV